MDTFPFAYECARKHSSLDNISLPELVNCGKCAAEVINAKEKNFDVSKSEACQVCYNKISSDREEAPKAMSGFVGCCDQNIKQHLSKQGGKQEAREEPSAPAERRPSRQELPPPDQERELTEPPLTVREDIYDQFEHDMLLPRQT